jgi:hypothetical protein
VFPVAIPDFQQRAVVLDFPAAAVLPTILGPWHLAVVLALPEAVVRLAAMFAPGSQRETMFAGPQHRAVVLPVVLPTVILEPQQQEAGLALPVIPDLAFPAAVVFAGQLPFLGMERMVGRSADFPGKGSW